MGFNCEHICRACEGRWTHNRKRERWSAEAACCFKCDATCSNCLLTSILQLGATKGGLDDNSTRKVRSTGKAQG